MARPKASPWRPRASNLGAFIACDQRAAFERAIAEGTIVLTPEAQAAVEEAKKSSNYADFGTCAHFHLQDGLRCVFPSDSKDHAPAPEEFANASTLFGGDTAATELAIRECALLGARHMPPSPDGKPWLTEAEFKTADLSGHIDFLSQCLSVIGDLKTTSRPPEGNRVKPEHLIQLCAYYLLILWTKGVQAQKAFVLYVSSKADWAMIVWVDFQTPEMQEYIASVARYVKFLRSKGLYDAAVPRIGKHCSDGWCPFKALCRDKLQPPPGEMVAGTKSGGIDSSVRVKSIFS